MGPPLLLLWFSHDVEGPDVLYHQLSHFMLKLKDVQEKLESAETKARDVEGEVDVPR